LPANAPDQSTSLLADTPLSLASQRLQGAAVGRLIVIDIAPTYICIFLRRTAHFRCAGSHCV